MNELLPQRCAVAADVLGHIVAAIRRAPAARRAAWRTQTEATYGVLDGQRGLSEADVLAHQPALMRPWETTSGADDGRLGLSDLVVALQSYVVLVCDLAAAAFAGGAPERYALGLARRDGRRLARELAAVVDGTRLARHGFTRVGEVSSVWGELLEVLDSAGLAAIRRLAAGAAAGWASRQVRDAADALGALHAATMPRNLLHARGEFYTPLWLAIQLVADSGWRPGQRLLDPFGGSGAFLLAALRSAESAGYPPRDCLEWVLSVDSSPVACAAARANLVMWAACRGAVGVRLPVLQADSLVSWPEVPGDVGAWESGPIAGADVVATNPPWVSWEHIPRSYRDALKPTWERYGLAEAGRSKAFLKDDLSTVALVTAWDRYLRDGGAAVAVVGAASMSSELAARGLRRLRLGAGDGDGDGTPLGLELVRVYPRLQIFTGAETEAATWRLRKGRETRFPVAGERWLRRSPGWHPRGDAALDAVRDGHRLEAVSVAPARADEPAGRWVVGDERCVAAGQLLAGESPYRGRAGVSTGGANAVFYVEPVSPSARRASAGRTVRVRNVRGRARRSAPAVEVELERSLLWETVRGRDLGRWRAEPGATLLCPHTAETRMDAISPAELAARYPLADRYLRGMRPILDERRGFTRWERPYRERAFYALQRVGDYTFAPFKVAWRYAATDFLAAVIGPDGEGRARLPNDKLAFVPAGSAAEAYFLAGFLSCSAVRWLVAAQTSRRQISPSAIASLSIPRFDPGEPRHDEIRRWCQQGHEARRETPDASISAHLQGIDRVVGELLGLPAAALAGFREELRRAGREL